MSPLEILSAEASVLENVTSVVALLGYVIDKTREVRHFRGECVALSSTCVSLYMTFLQNKAALPRTALRNEFWKCIQDTAYLVQQCNEWNILHISLDVVVKHRFLGLKGRLDEVVKAFGIEILMSMKGESTETILGLKGLVSQLDGMKTNVEAEFENLERSMTDKFRELQVQNKAIKEGITSLHVGNVNVDIVVLSETTALLITERARDGKPWRGTYENNPAIFQQILRKNTVSDGLPRLVKLYQDMSDVARIQRLHCVARDEDGVLFAVMEDMDQYLQLAASVASGVVARLNRLQKLRAGYELAQTVAGLHRANIVVKVLSDVTTFLEELPDGSFRPKLSQLDHARRIWETTTRESQDPRFDAPETEPTGSRSIMSDVWSLGVLLHVIFLGVHPFATPASETETEDQKQRIRDALRSGELPFSSQFPGTPAAELDLAGKCFNRDPYMRPTAPWIAEQLLELVIREGVATNHALSPTPLLDTDAANRILKALEDHIERARGKDRQKVGKVGSSEVMPLKKAAREGNPVYAYAVGHAYIHDLIETEQDPDEGYGRGEEPHRVRLALAALPYLNIAARQGHVGAIRQLTRAHKGLAEYYHALSKLGAED